MSEAQIRSALITNASDFAGRPAVAALGAAGFKVFVHDRAFAERDVWGKFAAAHPKAELIGTADAAAAVAAAWDRAGRIDALISNDHYPAVQEATDKVPLEELRRTLEILVVEPFAAIAAAIPRLKAQGGGAVVMITSCRTHLPIAGAALPDAARAAANALVRSWSVELAPFAIAVNAIAPNFLYSEAYYPKATFIDGEAGKAFVAAQVPAGRLGRPEEIGDLIRFLATTEACFLTGAIIDFAGGWPASPRRPG